MEIFNYRTINKGFLLASFSLKVPLPNGAVMIYHKMKHFSKNNAQWIAFPAEEYEKDGEKKFFPLISFEKVEDFKIFQNEVLKLLDPKEQESVPF